jgi:hypothetical protein
MRFMTLDLCFLVLNYFIDKLAEAIYQTFRKPCGIIAADCYFTIFSSWKERIGTKMYLASIKHRSFVLDRLSETKLAVYIASFSSSRKNLMSDR